MNLSVLVTVVGTSAGVLGLIVAVLQLRRTPRSEHRLGDLRNHKDHPVAELAQAAATGSLATSRVSEASSGEIPVLLHTPAGRLTEVWGRSGLPEALRTKLDSPDGKFQVLADLGGAGKTTVALALAEHVRDRGRHAWWISAVDAGVRNRRDAGHSRPIGGSSSRD